MNSSDDEKLQAILKEYADLPEFIGIDVSSVHTKGGWGNYPISVAAARGILEEVSVLISHGADVNIKGEHGYTPLHEAVQQGHVEVVKLLLENGAAFASKNDDGQTPSELAKSSNEDEILKVLQHYIS